MFSVILFRKKKRGRAGNQAENQGGEGIYLEARGRQAEKVETYHRAIHEERIHP